MTLLRALAFLLLTLVAFVLLAVAWLALIQVSGGSFVECDRGECGALGEFTTGAGFPVVALALLALAASFAWWVARRLGRRR